MISVVLDVLTKSGPKDSFKLTTFQNVEQKETLTWSSPFYSYSSRSFGNLRSCRPCYLKTFSYFCLSANRFYILFSSFPAVFSVFFCLFLASFELSPPFFFFFGFSLFFFPFYGFIFGDFRLALPLHCLLFLSFSTIYCPVFSWDIIFIS